MKAKRCRLVYPIGNGIYSKEFNSIKEAKEYLASFGKLRPRTSRIVIDE